MLSSETVAVRSGVSLSRLEQTTNLSLPSPGAVNGAGIFTSQLSIRLRSGSKLLLSELQSLRTFPFESSCHFSYSSVAVLNLKSTAQAGFISGSSSALNLTESLRHPGELPCQTILPVCKRLAWVRSADTRRSSQKGTWALISKFARNRRRASTMSIPSNQVGIDLGRGFSWEENFSRSC